MFLFQVSNQEKTVTLTLDVPYTDQKTPHGPVTVTKKGENFYVTLESVDANGKPMVMEVRKPRSNEFNSKGDTLYNVLNNAFDQKDGTNLLVIMQNFTIIANNIQAKVAWNTPPEQDTNDFKGWVNHFNAQIDPTKSTTYTIALKQQQETKPTGIAATPDKAIKVGDLTLVPYKRSQATLTN